MIRHATGIAAALFCALTFSQRLAADDTAKSSAQKDKNSAIGSSQAPPKAEQHATSSIQSQSVKASSSASDRQKRIEAETRIEEKYALEVIDLTNKERKKSGLAPLIAQANLRRSAAWLARDMSDNKYFSHTDSKGRSIAPRLPDFGYSDYSMIGENIAAGQETPAAVVAAWMKSPGHRANILAPEFREIGVAYYAKPGTKFRKYWVQDFGTPASSRD